VIGFCGLLRNATEKNCNGEGRQTANPNLSMSSGATW
jgi:hypothetical protein